MVRLEPERRAVIVGPREALRAYILTLRDLNWLGDGMLSDVPETGLPLSARIRSSMPPQSATLFYRMARSAFIFMKVNMGFPLGRLVCFMKARRRAHVCSAAAGSVRREHNRCGSRVIV